jgi:hypothetical protein
MEGGQMKRLSFYTLALLLSAGTVAHADVIVGAPANSSNAFPFISGPGTGVPDNGEYQQAYAASNFSGPITITGLSFVADATSGSPLGTLNFTGDYTVTLSYSANPVGSLSTNFASNIGMDPTTIFSGTISETDQKTLTILASTPFEYNPADGALLLTVVADVTGSGGLEANSSFPGGERVFQSSPGGQAFSDNMGLVTDFLTPTPLPAALPLFAGGLGALGLLGWRRKRAARSVAV